MFQRSTFISDLATVCTHPVVLFGVPNFVRRFVDLLRGDDATMFRVPLFAPCGLPPGLARQRQLSRNYAKALERVSRELEFFPKHLQHRSKQRLTTIHQYLIRMRKLKLKAKPKLVTINPKVRLFVF